MNAIKKLVHKKNDDPAAHGAGESEVPMRPSEEDYHHADPETMNRLGDEPNVTGGNLGDKTHHAHHQPGHHDAALVDGAGLSVHELLKKHDQQKMHELHEANVERRSSHDLHKPHGERSSHELGHTEAAAAHPPAPMGEEEFRERDPLADPVVVDQAFNEVKPGTHTRFAAT